MRRPPPPRRRRSGAEAPRGIRALRRERLSHKPSLSASAGISSCRRWSPGFWESIGDARGWARTREDSRPRTASRQYASVALGSLRTAADAQIEARRRHCIVHCTTLRCAMHDSRTRRLPLGRIGAPPRMTMVCGLLPLRIGRRVRLGVHHRYHHDDQAGLPGLCLPDGGRRRDCCWSSC